MPAENFRLNNLFDGSQKGFIRTFPNSNHFRLPYSYYFVIKTEYLSGKRIIFFAGEKNKKIYFNQHNFFFFSFLLPFQHLAASV